MSSLRLIAAGVALSLAATSVASAQCPNGTPPPCGGDSRQAVQLQFIPRRAPVALDDRTYIVLPFQNVTRAPDAEWLGDAAVNMLSMDLSRWQDIKVIDDRRVADYMRDVRRAPGTRLSMNDALTVAKRAGAGRVVVGDVMKVGNRTTVTATLFNARDGKQIRTAREETTVADSIVSVFGRIARQILAVPSGDANVGSVGTSRIDAYKEYVSGSQALNRFDATAAKKHLESALALDSNFALAHYKWAFAAAYDERAAMARQAQLNAANFNNAARLLEDPEQLAHAKTAARLSAGLPTRERTLITGLLAFLNRDYPRSCQAYGSLVRADSSDVEALIGYGMCLARDEMVVPVVPGDTTKMRFRSSWNEALAMYRRAASIDPSFHLAFDGIVSLLTAPTRVGCAYTDVVETCADTTVRRRYVAPVLRENDSLVTTPRSGFRTFSETTRETQRRTPARANVELASRAAADWVALGPTEAHAHKHLAQLLLVLGRTAEAEREITELLKDSVARGDLQLFLYRLDIALKMMRGAEVNRLLDSLPIVMPTELGRGAAVSYRVATGRVRGHDSSYDAAFDRQAGITKARRDLAKLYPRVMIGAPLDSVGAIEQAYLSAEKITECEVARCLPYLGNNYVMALRAPRQWPVLNVDVAAYSQFAAAAALAQNDTVALRTAARAADSISRGRVALARNEAGWTIIALDAYLALRDSMSALQVARRLTDTTLQLTSIDATLGIGPGSTMMLWPRAMLLRADLEAAKGNKAVAREYYTRFLALWANADPEFGPMIARVQSALAALR